MTGAQGFAYGDHICSVCELIHQTAPACAGCDDYLENQTWWYLWGQEQGRVWAEIKWREDREQLLKEIARLGGDISARVSKAAQGPSFPQLSEYRNEPERAKAHSRHLREVMMHLMTVTGVTDAHAND